PDRPPAPAMLDWTGSELLEWMKAQRGFRRTRSYGCLFKVGKPEPLEAGPRTFIGNMTWRRGQGGYQIRLGPSLPIGSIPEDKSLGSGARNRLEALLRCLAPGGLKGAGRMGDSIDRELVHEALEKLGQM
ncbi:MAG: hypothetical protein ACRDRO_18530, partial [Pseudonocardiaceae bacterium]